MFLEGFLLLLLLFFLLGRLGFRLSLSWSRLRLFLLFLLAAFFLLDFYRLWRFFLLRLSFFLFRLWISFLLSFWFIFLLSSLLLGLWGISFDYFGLLLLLMLRFLFLFRLGSFYFLFLT